MKINVYCAALTSAQQGSIQLAHRGRPDVVASVHPWFWTEKKEDDRATEHIKPIVSWTCPDGVRAQPPPRPILINPSCLIEKAFGRGFDFDPKWPRQLSFYRGWAFLYEPFMNAIPKHLANELVNPGLDRPVNSRFPMLILHIRKYRNRALIGLGWKT